MSQYSCDCTDVCDIVFQMLCCSCPHVESCQDQPEGDTEAEHRRLCECASKYLKVDRQEVKP